MQTIDVLQKIRPIWLKQVVFRLAQGAGALDDFRYQLEGFYDLLEQAIQTGNPASLDPILALWTASITQSDLEEGQTNLTHLIKELMLISLDVWRENLAEDEVVDITAAVLPFYAYGFEKAASLEMQARVEFISGQLSRTQQSLERLERSKSDFISVAAHELKTPLTLVEGYAAMLRETFSTTEQGKLLLEGINNGTHRLRLIVDDMIDVSLIDNNLMSITCQPLWLNRLFGVLRGELSESLAERRLSLEITPFPGSSEMIFGDPERLLQAFYNVISNAIKFTPDGGKIKLDGRKLPGFIEVTISDTGIGIDPDDQQIIFEKFGRLGNPTLHSSGKTKFKGGGPGLGLHISKGIFEAHGGTIWVESPGYNEETCPGSTFHILIPHRSEPPDGKSALIFAPLIQGNSEDL
jgi:signal transduction histidine kinase